MMTHRSTIYPPLLWFFAVLASAVSAGRGQAQQADGTRYWTTSWSFDSIDAGQLNRRLQAVGIDTGLEIDGKLSVNFDVGIPLNDLRNGKAYQFRGTLSSPDFRLQGVTLEGFEANVVYLDGLVRLTNFRTGVGADGRIEGRAQLQLYGDEGADQRRYAFQVSGNDLPVQRIAGLAAELSTSSGDEPPGWESLFSGSLDLTASGDGSLEKSDWRWQGSLASPGLIAGGVDLGLLEHDFEFTSQTLKLSPRASEMVVGNVDARYSIGEQNTSLDIRRGEVFGGNVTGNVALGSGPATDTTIRLNIDGIRPRYVADTTAGDAGGVAASVSGEVDWVIQQSDFTDPLDHRGQARLNIDNIELAKEDIGGLNVTVDAAEGTIDLDADGNLFDGTVRGSSTFDFDAGDSFSDWNRRLRNPTFQLSGISVNSASEFVMNRRSLYHGRLWVDATLRPGDRREDDVWDTSVRLTRFAIGSTPISSELSARFTTDLKEITSLRASGAYAGGNIRANGSVGLRDESGNWYLNPSIQMELQRIDLSRGLLPINQTAARYASGLASGRLSLTRDQQFRVRGRVTGRETGVSVFRFGRTRSQVSAVFSPSLERWSLEFRNVDSQPSRGHLRGEAVLSSAAGGGSAFHLSSRWKADRVDFVKLTSELGNQSSIARGQISGDVRLFGRRIRGAADLKGRFDLKLGDTRGAAIPGLSLSNRFLGPFSITQTRFETGKAEGVISAGALLLEEFWLRAPQARVHASGRITMGSGRMDLQAVIATGDFRTVPEAAIGLARRYAVQSVLPVSALLELARLISNRTIVIDVLGTVSDPRVRLQPLATFREEAARFLLREIVTVVAAGTRDSLLD